MSEEKFCFLFSEMKNCYLFSNKDLYLVDIIIHPRHLFVDTHGIQTYFKPLSCLTLFNIYREAGTHLKMEKGLVNKTTFILRSA